MFEQVYIHGIEAFNKVCAVCGDVAVRKIENHGRLLPMCAYCIESTELNKDFLKYEAKKGK